MGEKLDSAPPVKDAVPGKGGTPERNPHPQITATDNQTLLGAKPKDAAGLTAIELNDHVTPAVAEAFKKDPVEAMMAIYHKGLKGEDPATLAQRESGCRARLTGLQKDDPKLFGDITRIGEQIASNQLTPEQAGKEIAAAARGLLDRARAANGGKTPEFDDNLGTGLVALSSTMLAERGTFGDNHDPQKTKAMIDAAEAELRKGGPADMTMLGPDNKPYPAQIHGVAWANDGEPALCGWTTDGQKNRYKFELGL